MVHVHLGRDRLVSRPSTFRPTTINDDVNYRSSAGGLWMTYILSGTHTPRVINTEIPLVQSGDGKRGLALFLRYTGVFEISNGPTGEFKQPSCRRTD